MSHDENLQRLARETAEKILLQGRDVSMTMDEWKRRRPDLAKDLDEEVAALTPIILAALRQVQDEQREKDAQLCDDEAVRMTRLGCTVHAAGALYCEEAIKQQTSPPDYSLATLRPK